MMKKCIQTLVLLLFGFVTQAQKQVVLESKNDVAKAMSLFVENIKPAYQKGQTYGHFEKALLGNWKNTAAGTALLTKAYQYISKGFTKEQIVKEYIGQEFTNALNTSNNLKKTGFPSDGQELFGGTSKDSNSFIDKGAVATCKWFNLNCYISVFN